MHHCYSHTLIYGLLAAERLLPSLKGIRRYRPRNAIASILQNLCTSAWGVLIIAYCRVGLTTHLHLLPIFSRNVELKFGHHFAGVIVGLRTFACVWPEQDSFNLSGLFCRYCTRTQGMFCIAQKLHDESAQKYSSQKIWLHALLWWMVGHRSRAKVSEISPLIGVVKNRFFDKKHV